MNKYLIYYDNKLRRYYKKKYESIDDYIKFIVYFGMYYSKKNIIFLIGIAIILYFFPGNMFIKYITFSITGLSAYISHRLAHEIPFLGKISGHDYHHEETKNFYKKLMEFLSDMFAAGGLLLIINFILHLKKIYIFNNYVILLFMIGFPIVHFINYHYYISKSYHYYHHKNINTNFSPDIFDHLFGTNLDLYFEDNSHMLPIFSVVGIFVYYLSKKKFLEIIMNYIKNYIKNYIVNHKHNLVL